MKKVSDRVKKKVGSLMAMLFLCLPAMAQHVEQSIDSLEMLIGEQTVLHLKVSAGKNQKVVMPSYKPQQQMVPGIEVLEQIDGDTLQVGDGQIEFMRHYMITSFDERVYAIPALSVTIDGKSYHGNPSALKVMTVHVDTVHPNQFYPPKTVQDNPFQWSEWSMLFWLSFLVLLICALMYYLVLRLKQNKPIIARIRIVKRVPAHEKALSEINVIKQHRTVDQKGQKEYYTQLTTILREYIKSRFGFNAMEMTSSEIIDRLQTSGDSRMIDELKELFLTADLVKFAKYETLINENDANLVNAINFIDQTKTNEVPTEEKVSPELSVQDKKSQQQRKLTKLLLWLGGIAIVALLVYIIYGAVMLLI